MIKESIRILLSLFVMLEQNVAALEYYENYVSDNSIYNYNKNLPPKKELYVDEAIIESLWFQIIIKLCSYLDEYDKFLGITTEAEFKSHILTIKKVLAPARREFNRWKDLRKFRNEITAHNFRGRKSQVTIDKLSLYDCPNCLDDFSLIIQLLERMTRIITFNYPEELEYALLQAESQVSNYRSNKAHNKSDEHISETLTRIDHHITDNIWIIPRNGVVNDNLKAILRRDISKV